MFSIKHKLFISTIIFSIFFSVFFSGIAAAQTISIEDVGADNLFSMSLEDLSNIKVTSASKEKQSQGTVEGTVTVITRNQIEECGCTTLEELFLHMPGVFLVDTYEDLFIGMRGSIGGSVQFLLNGIPRHPVRIKGLTVPERARFNIPVEAIDRIEIVKGPKSVIYGNNAFLGSVNIITNDPEYDTNMVRAAAGNDTTGRGMARISHRFSEDAYLVANTEIYHTDGIDRDIKDSMSHEQAVDIDPNAKTSLDKMLQKTRFNTELYTNYKGLWADLNYSQMEYGFYAFAPGYDDGTQLDLNTLSLSLGYSKLSTKKLNFKIYGVYSKETYSFHPDWITEEADGYQHQASNRFEIETSVGFPLWKNSTILLGYNFQAITDAQNDIKFNVPDFVSNTESTPVLRNDLFTVLRQNIFNSLTLSAGARVSMISPYHITERYKETAASSDVIKEQTNFADKADIYLVPRASAIWEINNHNSLKAIYATAIENNRDMTIKETEHIRSGELVYWLSTKYFRGQLSGFVQKTDNVARRVQTLNSETGAYEKIIDNSGENMTKGTELELEFMPVKDLAIGGHVSFQHTKDNKNPDIPVANSPSWIAGFKTVYTIRPWPKNFITLMARGQFVDTMSADWYWTDQKDVWQRIGDDVPAWFTFGANIRYKNEKSGIILNLHGTNLLNADIRYPANELVNFAGGAFGPGRSVILTAGVDW